MQKLRISFTALIIGLIALGLNFGPGPAAFAASSKPVSLTILGLFPGSSMQQRAEAIAEVIRRYTPYKVTAKTARPGVADVMAVSTGRADMVVSLSTGFLSKKVLQAGAPDLLKKFAAETIIPTSLKSFFFVAFKDVPINSIPDLIAKKYPIRLIDGGGSSKVANQIMFKKVYGINIADIEKWGGKLHDSAGGPAGMSLLKQRQANAHLVYTGATWPVWEELNATHPIKVLPVAGTPEELAKAEKALPGFHRFYWEPSESKLIKKPVPTIGFAEELWVNPRLDEEVVYRITKALAEHRDFLISLAPTFRPVLSDPAKMVELAQSDPQVPLHPGAARYYRERGWLK